MSLCIPNPPALIFGREFITFYEKSEKIVIKEREWGGRKKKRGRERGGGKGEREKGKRLSLELKISALWRRPRE